MSLYRCAACGSPNVVMDTQKEGYSYAKGAIGTIVLGVGGAAAGINGKTKKVYKCPDCGLTLNEQMPFEIKVLIDMGVSSAEARENLSLQGIKITWDELKHKYINIESGFADKSIAERKALQANILTEKATATKEEFDNAIDILRELSKKDGYYGYKHRVFSATHPITKQEYLEGVQALNLVVENLISFFPPKAFSSSSVEYRNFDIYAKRLFDTYIVLDFYKNYGIAFPNSYSTYSNAFIIAFKEAYKEQFPEFGGILDEPYPNIFGRFFDYYDGSAIEYITLLVPRFIIKDEALGYSDFSFYDSPLADCEFKDIVENYFKCYPEQKEIYQNMLEKRNNIISYKGVIKSEEKKICDFENNIKLKNRQISEEKAKIKNAENMIVSLQNKIFGKAKAKLKIEEITADIAKTNENIIKIQNEIAQLQKKIQESKQKCNQASAEIKNLPSEIMFVQELLSKFDNFIEWHWVSN